MMRDMKSFSFVRKEDSNSSDDGFVRTLGFFLGRPKIIVSPNKLWHLLIDAGDWKVVSRRVVTRLYGR